MPNVIKDLSFGTCAAIVTTIVAAVFAVVCVLQQGRIDTLEAGARAHAEREREITGALETCERAAVAARAVEEAANEREHAVETKIEAVKGKACDAVADRRLDERLQLLLLDAYSAATCDTPGGDAVQAAAGTGRD